MVHNDITEYLKEYQNKFDEINRLNLELEQLRSLAEKITAASGGTQGGGKGAGFTAAVEKIEKVEAELERQVDEACAFRLKVEAQIRCVPISREQTVLKYRHINGYSIETTAELMGLSDTWIRKIYSDAVEHFDKYAVKW